MPRMVTAAVGKLQDKVHLAGNTRVEPGSRGHRWLRGQGAPSNVEPTSAAEVAPQANERAFAWALGCVVLDQPARACSR